jgi:uncharacterized protein
LRSRRTRRSSLHPSTTTKLQSSLPKVEKAHVPLWRRRTAHWSRWLHTYLSMGSFTILLFFAVTGLTLNHQSALTHVAPPTRYTGVLQAAWMNAPEAHKSEIINAFHARLARRGGLSDFRVDDDQVQISFRGPGYSADGFVDRHNGKYELNENCLGLVAILNDLHKGRDAGNVWAAVIDFSAILMVLLSLSGLVLIFFLHKRLRSGLIALATGTVVCYLVYQVWVP